MAEVVEILLILSLQARQLCDLLKMLVDKVGPRLILNLLLNFKLIMCLGDLNCIVILFGLLLDRRQILLQVLQIFVTNLPLIQQYCLEFVRMMHAFPARGSCKSFLCPLFFIEPLKYVLLILILI